MSIPTDPLMRAQAAEKASRDANDKLRAANRRLQAALEESCDGVPIRDLSDEDSAVREVTKLGDMLNDRASAPPLSRLARARTA